jgi:predicted nucleotidyltransferase
MGVLDAVSARYAHDVRDALRAELGEDLVGMYLYGSAATGPFLHGQSDVDVLAVVRDPLGAERIAALLRRVRAVELPSSVKGLDLWVVPLAGTRAPCAGC